MGIEIVLHNANRLCLWIDVIDQPANPFGIIELRTPLSHLHMTPPGQRLDHKKQVGCIQPLVFIIDPFGLPRFRGLRSTDNQRAG
ncbi:hypothetical protein KDA_46740 [Dictyobacter alpinus]|uniref:Uncharacterized protein n=1 Tax=Dictyobacter alpinus TaxID=2014873 RepID=A0A402BCZ3_9CHLR|nr:hypothetical protein KDA_46740 [Dictyobacter alpinus]